MKTKLVYSIVAVVTLLIVALSFSFRSMKGTSSGTGALKDIASLLKNMDSGTGVLFDTMECRGSSCTQSNKANYPTFPWRVLGFAAAYKATGDDSYKYTMQSALEKVTAGLGESSVAERAINSHQLATAYELTNYPALLISFYDLLPNSVSYLETATSQGWIRNQPFMLSASALWNLYAAVRLSLSDTSESPRFDSQDRTYLLNRAEALLPSVLAVEKQDPLASEILEGEESSDPITQFSCYREWLLAERYKANPEFGKENLLNFIKRFRELDTESIEKFETAMNLAPCGVAWQSLGVSDPEFKSAAMYLKKILLESLAKLECGSTGVFGSMELGGAKGPRCFLLTSENAWAAAAIAEWN